MFPSTPRSRRFELQVNDDVPNQAEVRSYLGSPLAEVFNDYSHDTSRTLLGVIPSLQGCQEEVWTCPSDQLTSNVVLKPPPTNKCIRACTHQGILEIGEIAALRFEEATEESMNIRLRQEMIEIRKMFEAEKRWAVEVNAEKVRCEYVKYIKGLNEDFKIKLKTALDEAAAESNKVLQKAMVQLRMDLTMEMMKKLRDEIGHTVDCLDIDFQETLQAQKHDMIADFNAIMRREQRKAYAAMRSSDQKNADEMFAQRRELELGNMAVATCILCTERMRCSTQKNEIRQCFEKQIDALKKILTDPTNKLPKEEFKEMKKIRKPLNELTEFFQVVEIIDKEGKKWRPIELDPEIQQLVCSEEEPTLSISCSGQNLFPPEHYDKISKPSAKSLKSYESLPYCHTEDKLYVRTDCKNGDTEVAEEKKTISELAEGARFTMSLRRSPKPRYQK